MPISNNDPSKDASALIKSMQKLSGSFAKFGKLLDDAADEHKGREDEWEIFQKKRIEEEKAEREAEKRDRDYERKKRSERAETTVRGMTAKFKMLEGSTGHASLAMTALSESLLGGAMGLLTKELLDWSGKLTSTYRDMTEVGQSFSGSMIQMAKQAGEAGLSLDQYASLMKKNSELGSIYKAQGKDLAVFAKSVREAARGAGLYGYSVDGLNDLTMEYVRRQTLFGRQRQLQEEEVKKSVNDLALETTGLAAVFGKSRADITKAASDAMRESTFIATMLERTGDQFVSSNKRIQNGITQMAALPGDVGNILAKMTAEATGWGGVAEGGEAAKQFIDAGLGGIVSLVDQYSKDMQDPAKDQAELLANFTNQQAKMFKDNIETLRAQARAGNRSAQYMLEHSTEFMRTVTVDQIRAAQAEAKKRTKFTTAMLSLDDKWAAAMGRIRAKMYDVLSNLAGVFGNILESFSAHGGFGYLEQAIESFGSWITSFLTTTDSGSKDLGSSLADTAKEMRDFPKFVKDHTGEALSVLWTISKPILEVIIAFKALKFAMRSVATVAGTAITNLTKSALNATGFGKKLMDSFGLNKDITIHARNVVVYGPGGKGNPLDSLGGGPSGTEEEGHTKGKGKWRERGRGLLRRFGLGGAVLGAGEVASEAFNAVEEGMAKEAEPKSGDIPKPETKGDAAASEKGTAEVGSGRVMGQTAAEAGGLAKSVAEDESLLSRLLKRAAATTHVFSKFAAPLAMLGPALETIKDGLAFHNGKQSFGNTMKNMARDILPSVGGWLGSLGGEIIGGGAGSLVAPGVGTAAGAMAGGYLGWQGGEKLTDTLLEWILGPKATGDAVDADLNIKPNESTDDMRAQMAKLADDLKNHPHDEKTEKIVEALNNLKKAIDAQTDKLTKKSEQQTSVQREAVAAIKSSGFDPR